MGLLSKMIRERPQFDVAFTVVELVSLSDGRRTSFRIIDACYSKNGDVVKTIELNSFDGDDAIVYSKCVKWCLDRISLYQRCIRNGVF